MESNQGESEKTRIDELDFFGTLAQSYGNHRALDVFQALNDDYIVRLAISEACKNRKDCSQESDYSVGGKPEPVYINVTSLARLSTCKDTTITPIPHGSRISIRFLYG